MEIPEISNMNTKSCDIVTLMGDRRNEHEQFTK